MLTIEFFGVLLVGLVTAIAWVDFRSLRIPDVLTLSLAVLGIIFQALYSAHGIEIHVTAGVAAFFGFWAVRSGHNRLKGQIGLGFGDVKTAGACAIWLDPLNFPLLVLFATAPALTYAAGAFLVTGRDMQNLRLPFGPFLGLALLLTWYGEQRLWF